jgi:adenylate cyclase
MEVEDVVDLLNDYFSTLVDVIFRHEGTIDKFVGDAILAVFGSPDPDPRQHENAVRAALAMHAGVAAVSAARTARRLTTCEIGVGIHCGEVLHGFIGSNDRMEFTVIGDAVNRASRYCDGAGRGEVLISEEVYQRVWNLPFRFEPVSIGTKHEGNFAAFRLTAMNGSGS